MASPYGKSITVPIVLEPEAIVEQLRVLRTLASQIGFALDTAILSLTEPASGGVVDAEKAPRFRE